jgi:hypothetical protein
MLLVAMKRPIRLPLAVEPHCAQVEHGLRACFGPAPPGLFLGIGGLHPGLGARHVRDQGLEILLHVLSNLVCIGSHGASPFVSRRVALPDDHPRLNGFQLTAFHSYLPLRGPHRFWPHSSDLVGGPGY